MNKILGINLVIYNDENGNELIIKDNTIIINYNCQWMAKKIKNNENIIDTIDTMVLNFNLLSIFYLI